jgi:FkbM family methyltransferase
MSVDIRGKKAFREYVSWQGTRLNGFKGGFDYGEQQVANWLKAAFVGCHNGIIVDVGANDGVTQSHSLPFIEKGWRAVLIEPHPKMFQVIKDIYEDVESVSIIKSAVYNGDKTELLLHSGDAQHLGHSTLAPPEEQSRTRARFMNKKSPPHLVNADSLTNILKQCDINEKIDILHIDAEDFGIEVLKSLDFEIYDPKVISIDVHHDPKIGDPLTEALIKFMRQHNYGHEATYAQSLWKKND